LALRRNFGFSFGVGFGLGEAALALALALALRRNFGVGERLWHWRCLWREDEAMSYQM